MILPGLVNAHTHLDLSGAAGQTPPTQLFPVWLKSVIGYRMSRSAVDVQADIQSGFKQLATAGTAAVADIRAGGSPGGWPSDRICGTLFHEVIGLAPERGTQMLKSARNASDSSASANITHGLSPHSPYSVGRAVFAGLQSTDDICVHLAESAEELELLEHRTGPFVEFLQSVNAWHPTEILNVSEILAVAHRVKSMLIAHGNLLTAEQWRTLPATASVVYCPRTHHAFGHPPHPYQQMLADGVNVALGTDSLASNPDLDVWNEARFLHAQPSSATPQILVRMATLNGWQALNRTASNTRDWLVLPLRASEPDPFCGLLEADPSSRCTLAEVFVDDIPQPFGNTT